MRRLILVRHSAPEIRADVPAARWHLSPAGVARARAFARHIETRHAAHLFTSEEPKAVETAEALASVLGLAVECVPGLHEHERPDAQILSRDAFERNIRGLFDRPGELVFGAETGDQARRRFTMAVMRLLARAPGDVIVVSHGTVMTLFVAAVAGVEPFAFWKRQQMPCAVTLTLPDLRVEGTACFSPG